MSLYCVRCFYKRTTYQVRTLRQDSENTAHLVFHRQFPHQRLANNFELTRPNSMIKKHRLAPRAVLQALPARRIAVQICHGGDKCMGILRLDENSALLVHDFRYGEPIGGNNRQRVRKSFRDDARIALTRVKSGQDKAVILPQFLFDFFVL